MNYPAAIENFMSSGMDEETATAAVQWVQVAFDDYLSTDQSAEQLMATIHSCIALGFELSDRGSKTWNETVLGNLERQHGQIGHG